MLVKELLQDVFSLGHTYNPAEPYTLSPKYHSLPVEARRGVEIGPLPTHLMVEYELAEWKKAGALAPFKHLFAIVAAIDVHGWVRLRLRESPAT